jgi:hypothetical protein
MQRIPDDCESGLTNMLWLMMGIFPARSAQLNLAARKVPIRAKKLSIVKQLGWHFLEVCLRLFDPIPIVAIPNFSSVPRS